MLRFAKVSSVDKSKGCVRVIVQEKGDQVSNDLPMLSNLLEIPAVGELVACMFADDSLRKGLCLGKFYHEGNGFNEDLTTNRGLSVKGNIAATGTIMDKGGNSNNHTH